MTERRSLLGVIFLTVFLDIVGFSIIFPLFPGMLEHYLALEGKDSLIGRLAESLASMVGSDDPEVDAAFRTQVLFGGVLGSLYSTLQFICAPLWGAWSDRVGRRRVLLMTTAGMALSYVAWFFSGTFAVLLAARLFGGAMAGNISVASAAVADGTDARERTRGMAIVGMAIGLGFVIGPAIGASLMGIDLRGSLGTSLGVNPFSAPAGAALILAVLNFVWVARRFAETLPSSGVTDATAHRGARPLSPLRIFRSTNAAGVNRTQVAYLLFTLLFAGMEFTLTFLTKDRFAWGHREIAIMFVVVGLVAAFTQGGLVRRLAPKLGEKKLALQGLVLLVAGMLAMGLATESRVLFWAGLVLLSIGSSFVTPAFSGLVSLYASNSQQGEVLGGFRSLGALGRAVGPIAASVTYWHFGSVALYVACAVAMLLPLALAGGLPPVRRE